MSNIRFSNSSFLWTSTALIALLIASLLPRGYELGEIGFQKDEEYTALVALSLVEGNEAELPSGMSYRRALPLTYLSAGAALLLGEKNEASYRLPATFLGALSPLVLFLLLRSTIGGVTAFVAALMLALSEWHILVSREARMYAPFLLFYTCTVFYTWQWIATNKQRYLLTSIIFFAVSISLHKLAILATIFTLVPFLTNTKTAVSPIRAIYLFLGTTVCAFLFHKFYVGAGYKMFTTVESGTIASRNPVELFTDFLEKIPVTNIALIILLLASGAIAGYWLARTRLEDTKSTNLNLTFLGILAYFSFAILTGMFVFAGLIYAACLTGILFFAIHTGLPSTRLQMLKRPLGLLTVIIAFWIGYSIWHHGMHDGIKIISSFPFPYFAYFTLISPGLLMLFLCACVYLFNNYEKTPELLRFSVIATIIPLFAVGVIKDWGGARYLISAYPFLIITAAIVLVMLIEKLGNKTGWWDKRGTALLATFITASGLLGGNGIPSSIYAATLSYGEPDYWPALVLPSHPDHQSAGRFVQDHIQPDDIVVAEDASMQKWYTGKVDYWLRNFNDAKAYLYQADDGHQRDIYVNSRIVTAQVLNQLEDMAVSGQRVWIITSAEVDYNRSYYLSESQLLWLGQLEESHQPMHTGRDGITKVFCMGCD